MDRNLSTTVYFFDSSHKFFYSIDSVNVRQRRIQSPVKHLRWSFLRNCFGVNYFCIMLHLRCLTRFWICLGLRLRSLKFYLFSRNTNFMIKSRLPYQFWKLFTVVIRTRPCYSMITVSIIFDIQNTINSWRIQESVFTICFHSKNYFAQTCVSWHLSKISRF